jgi:thiamine pyrophosphate-dependent acetolactate synthase large subunit-like protein
LQRAPPRHLQRLNGSRSRYSDVASLVTEREVRLQSSHGSSGGGFGAQLAASYVEEGNDRNHVVAFTGDGG